LGEGPAADFRRRSRSKIDRAHPLSGPGAPAGACACSADGIKINAGANDKINLRGLLLGGSGTGALNGITFSGDPQRSLCY
jgi:hypothetical protein